MEHSLAGKRVAVLVDHTFIWKELDHYLKNFSELGAQLDLLTNLWGQEERELVPSYDNPNQSIKDLRTLTVDKDVADADHNDYDLVIMAANYCSVRLREILPMGSIGSPSEVASSPAVRFYASAMENKKIIKGAMCHALLILTPRPELAKNRKVICHSVVLADILNAGFTFVSDGSHVVIDDDLVTARSAADLDAYFNTLVEATVKRSTDF